MYRLTTYLKCDVYGVEAEKRREEKRREEKRREEEGTLVNIHPPAKAAEVPVLSKQHIIIMYQQLPFGSPRCLPCIKAGEAGKVAA
jgi:hypothetical protein